MILSVLIPTVEGREKVFETLWQHLEAQNTFDDVELLQHKDNKELSIGAKRQQMIEKAVGDFVVFIDDDDWVPDDYIKTIRETIINHPSIDCIGFFEECDFDGQRQAKAIHSNKYSRWCENKDGFDYVRTIFHKDPVRRAHALKIGFKDMRFAEDHDYSQRLKRSGLLKKEYFLYKTMYFYRYKEENHNKKYGIK